MWQTGTNLQLITIEQLLLYYYELMASTLCVGAHPFHCKQHPLSIMGVTPSYVAGHQITSEQH